ncbi:MAG TPA: hypothetical protein VFS92_09565 [Planctomycetota bacterium]|nr:hypothetical protein [Planctomycetota bacterium]
MNSIIVPSSRHAGNHSSLRALVTTACPSRTTNGMRRARPHFFSRSDSSTSSPA